MNVLHIGTGNLFGGVERNLITLAQTAALCPDMRPSFAACFEGRLTDELQAAGADLHWLLPMRGRSAGAVLRNRARLRALQRDLRTDVTVFHSLWSWTLLGLGARSSAPSAVWFHDAVRHMHLLERVARLQRPDVLLANSRYTASTVARLYRRAAPAVVYYPFSGTGGGRPAARRSEIRERCATPPGDVVIVQVSRLEPYKGHRLHLEALRQLKDVPGWTVWFVGGKQRASETAYWEELQSTAGTYGLADRVRFLGQRTDTADILAAADIHCQPNLGPEPFGLTFIEALSAGLPVVTTAMGAAPEIVNSECGLLIPPHDADELAGALRRLLTDAAWRRRLARHAPARAQALCQPEKQLRELYRAFARAGSGPAAARAGVATGIIG